MKLSRRHWLVRLAYSHSYREAPDTITLCVLFWRAIFSALGWVVISLPLLMALGMYVHFWFTDPMRSLAITAVIVGVVSIVTVAVSIARWRDKRYYRALRERDFQPQQPTPPSLMGEAFYGLKNRVCPLIRLED